jgi:succinylglutamate desuccinylase
LGGVRFATTILLPVMSWRTYPEYRYHQTGESGVASVLLARWRNNNAVFMGLLPKTKDLTVLTSWRAKRRDHRKLERNLNTLFSQKVGQGACWWHLRSCIEEEKIRAIPEKAESRLNK